MLGAVSRWPIGVDCTGPIAIKEYWANIKEVACMTVPLSIYGETARTFDDVLPALKPMWGPFMQQFFKTAEDAVRTPKSGAMLFNEMVVNSEETPVGYRFFLLTREAGDLLSSQGDANIAFYQVMKAKNNSDKDAAKFLKRIEADGPRANEMWKIVHGPREWKRIVEACTGASVPERECHFSTAFAMERAILASPEDTCERQMLLAPADATGEESYVIGDVGGKTLRWMRRDLMYRVPGDMVEVNRLYNMVFPHAQAERDILEHRALILVPLMVGDESAVAEADADAAAHRAKARRAGLMRRIQAAPFDEMRGAENDTALMRAGMKRRATAALDMSEQQENVTPYQPLLRVANKNAALIKKMTPTRPELSNDAVPFMEGSGGTASWEQIRNDATRIRRRRLLLTVRSTLLELFASTCTASPKRSAGAVIVHRATAAENYLDTTGRTDHYARTQTDLSPLANMVHKFFVALELVKFVNQSHAVVNIAEISRHDGFRESLEMRFSLILASIKGATSKSASLELARTLSIPGIVVKITKSTPAANAVEGDEFGNNNFSDQVQMYDEMDPEVFDQSAGGTSTREASIKSQVSNCESVTHTLKITDEGKRIMVAVYARLCNVTWGCMNMRVNAMSDAMTRRFFVISMSEERNMTRPLVGVMGQQMRAPAELAAVDAGIVDVYRQKMALIFFIEKMIGSGVLPDVSVHGFSLLSTQVLQYMERFPYFARPNPDVLKRLCTAARHRAMTAAYIDVFFHPSRPPGPIRLEEFLKLERRLFISAEHTVMALGDLYTELIPPLRLAVRRALFAYYQRRLEHVRLHGGVGFQDLFRASYTSADRTAPPIYDYTYMSFRKSTLIQEVRMLVPPFMGGYMPSGAAVAEALSSFTTCRIVSRPMKADVDTKTIFFDQSAKETAMSVAYEPTGGVHERYEILSQFVLDVGVDARKDCVDATQESLLTLREAIEYVLNARHQLPRVLTMGQVAGAPHLLSTFKTGEKPGAGLLAIPKVVKATPDLRKILPEYAFHIGTHDDVDFEILMCDIDTYAMALHDNISHVTFSSVPDAFIDEEEQQQEEPHRHHDNDDDDDKEEEEEEEACGTADIGKWITTCCCGQPSCTTVGHSRVRCRCTFAGKRVSSVSPDRQRQWAVANAERIRERICDLINNDDIDQDVDFADLRHTGHWRSLRKWRPEPFGFKAWPASEIELMRVYKMVAYHPTIRQDLWQMCESVCTQ